MESPKSNPSLIISFIPRLSADKENTIYALVCEGSQPFTTAIGRPFTMYYWTALA